MPAQRRIEITRSSEGGGGSPRVKFDPDPLQAKVWDQIFWTNNDSEPHWPALLKKNGKLNKTFFMPNQIAPNGDTSSVFAPNAEASYTYVCSLHPERPYERGKIEVTES